MTLDWAILANSAEVRESLAFMLGGGIDTINTPQLPANLRATLLLRLLLHRTETDRPHVIELRCLSQDGREIAPTLNATFQAPPPPDLPVGWEVPAMFAINIQNLELPEEAHYSIEILVDGTHVKSLHLRARVGPPTPQS
jgi:hypothetical protein